METFLILFSLLVLLLGIFEYKIHHNYLENIPIRIHVNGSRGKSSVVRLIAAGLRAGNIKVFGKTTGTSPRIIDENGEDKYIHRYQINKNKLISKNTIKDQNNSDSFDLETYEKFILFLKFREMMQKEKN